jgi:hypothetical protein
LFAAPPKELGALWGLSSDTIRRLFEDEPGVLMIGKRKKAIAYSTNTTAAMRARSAELKTFFP